MSRKLSRKIQFIQVKSNTFILKNYAKLSFGRIGFPTSS